MAQRPWGDAKTQKRDAELGHLSQEGRLLYQLIERQDDLKDELQKQTARLEAIKTSTTWIVVLMVLSAIGSCLVAIFGGSILGL